MLHFAQHDTPVCHAEMLRFAQHDRRLGPGRKGSVDRACHSERSLGAAERRGSALTQVENGALERQIVIPRPQAEESAFPPGKDLLRVRHGKGR